MSSRSPNLSLLLQNWNPQRARLACFQQILPLVRDLLTGDKKEASPGAGATAGAGAGSVLAANDRLLQLIIKGALMSRYHWNYIHILGESWYTSFEISYEFHCI